MENGGRSWENLSVVTQLNRETSDSGDLEEIMWKPCSVQNTEFKVKTRFETTPDFRLHEGVAWCLAQYPAHYLLCMEEYTKEWMDD